jgi:hypothetical protein
VSGRDFRTRRTLSTVHLDDRLPLSTHVLFTARGSPQLVRTSAYRVGVEDRHYMQEHTYRLSTELTLHTRPHTAEIVCAFARLDEEAEERANALYATAEQSARASEWELADRNEGTVVRLPSEAARALIVDAATDPRRHLVILTGTGYRIITEPSWTRLPNGSTQYRRNSMPGLLWILRPVGP